MNQSNSLNFEENSPAPIQQPTEDELNDVLLGNLQKALGLSKEEIAELFAGEHYNHQY